MTAGKNIEKRGHIIGFQEEISNAANSSDDDFYTWFNSARDKDASFIRGSWDFILHIALPASKFITKPEDKVALEIGHGGGRILAAASRHFKNVIGIDIHDNNQKVESELIERGICNFKLLQTNGSDIPLEDASIDFVYSFIVLQHVEKYQIFKKYLQEAYRVSKPGAVLVLYFGRKYKYSIEKSSKIFYLIDKIAEQFVLPKGYQELPARVNSTNLRVSLFHAKQLAKNTGFEVLEDLVSHKKVPDGIKLYGGQNGLVLRKKMIS
jgi:ubiquinone/menaquinone biosynthesis C-methylase UbiE